MNDDWPSLLWSIGSLIELEIVFVASFLSIKCLRNLKFLRKDILGSFLAWTYLVTGCTALHHLIMALKFADFNLYFLTGLIILQLGVYANIFVMLQNRGRMPVEARDRDHENWLLINYRGEKLPYTAPPEYALAITDTMNDDWAGRDYFECVFGEKDPVHTIMLSSARYPWLCDVIPGKRGVGSLGDALIVLGTVILGVNIITNGIALF